MKYLLDTHAFLWWIAEDNRLSEKARQAIQDPDNEVFLSVASAWEIAIKTNLKKLSLPKPPLKFIPQQVEQNNFSVLPIQLKHALGVAALAKHHEDPFDRLLISQSLAEKMPLISSDKMMRKYRVKLIW